MINGNWIAEAINIIRSGMAQRLDRDGVTVYACGNIVRIDVKNTATVEKISQNCDEAEREGQMDGMMHLAQSLESRYAYYDKNDMIPIKTVFEDINEIINKTKR